MKTVKSIMTTMESNKILENAVCVIKTSALAILTTLNMQKQPDTCAMMNLRNMHQFKGLENFFADDNLATYITTNTSSAKMKYIAQNPVASLYYFTPDTVEGVTLIGKVVAVLDVKVLHDFWQQDWEAAYPGGRDGGDYTLLHFLPETLKYYDGAFGKHQLHFPFKK